MKVAVITDDGKTISQHFGRARYYRVMTIEDGKIVASEMRDKLGHTHFSKEEQHTHQPGQMSGMGADSHNKHVRMADVISDCKAVLCGGMGMGAYQSMQQLNIQPVVTDLRDAEAAALAYARGEIVDRTDKLH